MTRYVRFNRTHHKSSNFVSKKISSDKEGSGAKKGFQKNPYKLSRSHSGHQSNNDKRQSNPKNLKNNKVCFACRRPGHSIEQCTSNIDTSESLDGTIKDSMPVATGICYHCGSFEHKIRECRHPNRKNEPFKFATCFVCKEDGHLSGQCKKNEKGLYPNGGGCRFCNSVRHLAKDCDPAILNQEGGSMKLGTITMDQGGDDDDVFLALHKMDQNPVVKDGDKENVESEKPDTPSKPPKKVAKVVDF